MMLRNHYQNAYITHDLERAIDIFRSDYGYDDFFPMEISNEVTTPSGPVTSVTKMALGWIGGIQYELIQPIAGTSDIYDLSQIGNFPMGLHHTCMRVENWEAFRTDVERRKWQIVMEGEGAGGQLKFIYVDARRSLGHYLEYCWMTAERWAAMGGN